MKRSKVAISIDQGTLQKLDNLVKDNVFQNRSRAIEEALEEKINRMEHIRLAEQCSKLNPLDEQILAEEGISSELGEWPAY